MLEKRRGLLPFLFLLSGLTSLVYESLWIRTLSIALGSTTLSISLVIGLFFFGLAMGSFIGSRVVPRLSRPLVFYGVTEAFIGVYSFFLLFLLFKIPELLNFINSLTTNLSWVSFIKPASVFFLLTPPTLAMGLTFPLLVGLCTDAKQTVNQNVSFLYGLNTLGALIGAFATGFFLIPMLGLVGSNALMVLINLAIAALIFFKLKSFEFERFRFLDFQSQTGSKQTLSFFKRFLLFTSTIIGVAAIGAEIVWNKYLTLFLGTNIFGVSLTLSIFLFGIATGSLILAHVKIPQKPLNLLISLLSFAIVMTLLSTSFLNQAPLFAQSLIANFGWNPLFAKGSLAALILFPPTALFGALLPLTVHIMSHKNKSEAATISGLVYGWNTLGGIAGAMAVGLYLIPQLGSSSSLVVLCCLMGLTLVGLVLIGLQQDQFIVVGPLQIGIVCLALLFSPSVNYQSLVRTAEFSYRNPKASKTEIADYLEKTQYDVRYWAEGKNAVVSLHYDVDEQGKMDPQRLILKSNGLSESFFDLSNPAVVPKYEALLAVVPYLYQKSPKKAFVVGYGGGYTTELLSNFSLEKIVVAEIEEKVLEASEYVYLGDNPLLLRPNIDVQIEDARFLLNVSPQNDFDIIASQPSHSWMSGVAHLFTQDFFRIVKSRLKEHGVFAQWLNLYNMDQTTLKSIIHTFFTEFPHGALFTQEGDDQLILLGSKKPLQLQYLKLQELTSDPYWQERLIHVPFDSEFDFLSNFSMDRSKAMALSAGALLNSDRNAFAEVRQSRLYYGQAPTPLGSFIETHFLSTEQEIKMLLENEVQRTQKSSVQ